ncbi:MAG: response regulator [bacterium]|nr:response regulator [bacterium]
MKKKVLIAEEHPGMSDYLKTLFGVWGFDVLLAGDGKEAMEIVRHEYKDIDLIVVEQHLPVIAGFRVLQAAKAMRSEIKVFVLTADARDENVAELNEAGFDWVFVKPMAMARDFRVAFKATLPELELAQ